MIINHNIAALNTYRQLSSVNNASSKSLEKLSSGLRINRAGDDAAGLAISEKMRGQIKGLDQATRNAQDAISLIQTAEGGLNETHAILQRMRELSAQAANDTLSTEDRTAISDEITQLNSEIDRVSKTTQFNSKNLLDGTLGVQIDTTTSGLAVGSDGVVAIDIAGAAPSTTYTIAAGSVAGEVVLDDGNGNQQTVTLADNTAGVLNFDFLGVKITVNNTWTIAALAAADHDGVVGNPGTVFTTASSSAKIQIGANTSLDEALAVSINDMGTGAAALNTTGIAVDTHLNAQAAVDTIDAAIAKVSAERSKLGAYQNRLEHTINNLGTASENLTAAESRVRDVDYAEAA